ncbi:hypothetical protein V6N11_010365 [Hibiscus sabdariffa]|uniref:Uncharacterized protein n=1 Tax=Hibiscus sabdariffa TaxID=183260 RepID=A0ABR2S576_9ROSI
MLLQTQGMHCPQCLGGYSSSSGLEGAVLETVLPAGALPFLWVERSFLELVPAGRLGRMKYGVPLVIAIRIYHSHHQMRDELLQFHQPSQSGWQMVVVKWQRRSRLDVSPQVGKLRSFDSLQLASELEDVEWGCLFRLGRWWG